MYQRAKLGERLTIEMSVLHRSDREAVCELMRARFGLSAARETARSVAGRNVWVFEGVVSDLFDGMFRHQISAAIAQAITATGKAHIEVLDALFGRRASSARLAS